jgi:hypothetical protein
MRDSNETITSRIRREDLVGLLDSMGDLERQRPTAEMQAIEVPEEAVREPARTPAGSHANTIPRVPRRSYPSQVDAAIDAIIDNDAIEILDDVADDRITQPVTYSISETALDDFVVRFATGTGTSPRLARGEGSGPTISSPSLSSPDLRPRLPRWAIVAVSCVVTLLLAGLLIAAA